MNHVRRLACVVLLVLVHIQRTAAAAAAAAASPIRIVQYNVEWLFTTYYAASDCPGNGCTWKNQSMAETHIQTVAANIQKIDPTIVNFCEVEGVAELDQVASTSSGLTPYFIKGKDTSTGQNVGLLSKIVPQKTPYRTEERATYPIPGSKCGYTGTQDTTGVSKHSISEFVFAFPTEKLTVAFIAAHLLAFPTDAYRCAEREAQATVLRTVIQGYLDKEYEVLFLGDLNDYDAEIPDMNSHIPTSQVLDLLKVDGKLTNVAEAIPQSERYTEWWDENGNCRADPAEYSMIDHILVTPRLRSHLHKAYIYHGYAEECNTYQSDHFPVVVEFV